MSEKKELRWENPAEIYVPSFLNNRKLNPAYVESLEESMTKDGFLPTFPIVCFRRIDLPFFDDVTSELYICAAGAHRTTAAQNIELPKVYIDLRTGTMDDFIEAMHTDNFQFDPALDTSLGQLFTKTEKREACKQLLLIPKYAKLTNVALEEMWHTSNDNIRRWRSEVESLINEDPDHVTLKHLSEERRAELQEILASKVRENADGSTVPIRSKPNTDKWDYYWSIQAKVKDMQDLEWDPDVRAYCLNIYEKEPGDLSIKKMSELDRLISERDKDFLEKCRVFGDAQRKINVARDACHQAFRECEDTFKGYLQSMDLYEGYHGDEYKACLKSFGRAVRKNFGKNLLASKLYADTVAKYERETMQLNELKSHIEKHAEYVEKFAKRYLNRRLKKRGALEAELVTAQHEMLAAAKEKYPDLDLTKFTLAVDSDSYWLDMGTTPAFPMKVSHIPEGKKDSDIEYIRDHYVRMREQVEEGKEWVERLMIVAENQADESESLSSGNVLSADERTDRTPIFRESDPDKEGLSEEFKRIFTLHNRFDRDIVDCRALGETYHLPEEEVQEEMDYFQGELSALEIAVRKEIKASPDISGEDIADRVEVDDVEIVKAMLAKVQLDPEVEELPSIAELDEKVTEEMEVWKQRHTTFVTDLTHVTKEHLLQAYRYCYGDRNREGEATAEELHGILESLVQGHQPLILGANQAWRNSQNAEQTEANSVVSEDAEPVETSPKLITDVLGEDGTLTLRISWFSQNPDMDADQMGIVTFGDEDFPQSRPLSEIPGDLLVKLLEIAQASEPS